MDNLIYLLGLFLGIIIGFLFASAYYYDRVNNLIRENITLRLKKIDLEIELYKRRK